MNYSFVKAIQTILFTVLLGLYISLLFFVYLSDIDEIYKIMVYISGAVVIEFVLIFLIYGFCDCYVNIDDRYYIPHSDFVC